MPEIKANILAGKPGMSPFFLLGLSDDPALQLRCAKLHVAARLPAVRSASPDRLHRNDRIKVAYLSADFREHPTAYLMAELFERHDRSRFEVLGVSFGEDDGSAMRARLVRAFDQFIDVRRKSDREIAEFLKAQKVVIFPNRNRGDQHLGELLRELGFTDSALKVTHFDEGIWRLWQGEVPTIAALRARNRTCLPVPVCGGEGNDHDGYFGVLATKLLLNAGRGRELARLYDGEGLVGLSPSHLTDRPGILAGVTGVISESGANIRTFESGGQDMRARIEVALDVHDRKQLERILTGVKRIPGVFDIERVYNV